MAWDSNSTEALVRTLHIFAGVVWIGLLYFFNLVNLPVFNVNIAGGDPAQKGGPNLMLRALWWFRWGAMATLAFGLILLDLVARKNGGYSTFFATNEGQIIGAGMALALVMWFNVWFIIWPAQKVVLNNNIAIAKGAAPDEKTRLEGVNKPLVARAKLASRTNFWLSIPMLLLMVFAAHAPQILG